MCKYLTIYFFIFLNYNQKWLKFLCVIVYKMLYSTKWGKIYSTLIILYHNLFYSIKFVHYSIFNPNSLNIDLTHPSKFSYCVELHLLFTTRFLKVWNDIFRRRTSGGQHTLFKINLEDFKRNRQYNYFLLIGK